MFSENKLDTTHVIVWSNNSEGNAENLPDSEFVW